MTSQEVLHLKDIVLKQIVNLGARVRQMYINDKEDGVFFEFKIGEESYELKIRANGVHALTYLYKDYRYTHAFPTRWLELFETGRMINDMQHKTTRLKSLVDQIQSLEEENEMLTQKMNEVNKKIVDVKLLIENL